MRSGTPSGGSPAHPPAPSDAPPDDGCLRYEALREQLPEVWREEAWPAPMIDGYLCGVLLQPRPVSPIRWWSVLEALTRDAVAESALDSGRPPVRGPSAQPNGAAAVLAPLKAIAEQRLAHLDAAIGNRHWFDPWVLQAALGDPLASGAPQQAGSAHVGEELSDEPGPDDDEPSEGFAEEMPAAVRESLYPWVAGFMEAMVQFGDLLELGDAAAAEPQALLCQFLDRDDLEDADALWDLVDTLEPPAELADGVECLVRATLLLADITRPVRREPARDTHRATRGATGPGGGRGPGRGRAGSGAKGFNRGGSPRS